MTVCLTLYRAAIGAFHSKCYCRIVKRCFFYAKYCGNSFLSLFINILQNYVIETGSRLKFLAMKSYLQNSHFNLLIMILIVLAMDVERNPGPASEISIFNWNARSIRNKMEYLADIADEYNILCLTETHLDNDIHTDDILLDNFSSPFRKDRNFAGGGILIYCSDTLFCTRRNELESPSEETIWIEVKLNTISLLLCTVYRPPSANPNFWENFIHSVDKASEISNHILITGDINVDMLSNFSRHPLNDLMIQFGLSNIIDEPTRIGAASRTLLDPILISECCSYTSAYVVDVDRAMSDHNASVCHLKVPVHLCKSYKRSVWIYKNGDFNKFNNLISEFNWVTYFGNSDINEACEKFTDKYLSLAKQCIPFKEVIIRKTDRPWMNSDIRREIRIRNRLHSKYKTTKSLTHLNKFKAQRNKVNNMKKHSRLYFFENINGLIDTLNTSDPRSYWKLINKITRQSGHSSTIPPLFDLNSRSIISDDSKKADILNKYFCSISTIDDSNENLPDFPNRTDASFESLIILEKDVSDILGNLKLGKATGCDTISHNMLKATRDSVSKPLSILFNLSLNSATFPNIWKKAIVLPLYKKGDKHEVSNYRPVSLLSCVGKIFERVVFKYMYNYTVEHNLIYQYQSGFLPNHSTVYQLIEMYDSICKSLEQKQHTCMIFCDISKAFDRVWHRGLIQKLRGYGFKGKFLQWVVNYLHNREQQVLVNNQSSCFKKINAGVPQGSVLGPLLFLIYINDIADSLETLARLFADDTSLSYSSEHVYEIENVINRDLHRISSWSKTWLIKFNPSKTNVLFLTNSTNFSELNLIFDDNVLEPVSSHRHLGVTLSSDCKWSSHIDSIYQSCMKKICVLRKFKYILNRQTLLKIFKCFILPVLEYASELWDGCSQFDKQRLESIQLEAARIACGLPIFCKKEFIYKEAELETLENRRDKKKLVLFYKMHNHLVPPYLSNLLPPLVSEISNYSLRNNNDYTIPNTRLRLSERAFINSTTHRWNSLNQDIRNKNTVETFKAALSANIIKLPAYYLCGKRKYNILHTRLRHQCSSLNYDLFRCNLVADPSCRCGSPCENSFHFFFECPLYTQKRNIMLNNLSHINTVTLDLLLSGDELKPLDQNIQIFQTVHKYIHDTMRFN